MNWSYLVAYHTLQLHMYFWNRVTKSLEMDVFGFLRYKPRSPRHYSHLFRWMSKFTYSKQYALYLHVSSWQDYFSPPPLEPVMRRSPSPALLLQPLRVRTELSFYWPKTSFKSPVCTIKEKYRSWNRAKSARMSVLKFRMHSKRAKFLSNFNKGYSRESS